MSSFIASSALFLPTGPTIALRGHGSRMPTRFDRTFAAVDKAKRRVHHGPRSHEPIEGSS